MKTSIRKHKLLPPSNLPMPRLLKLRMTMARARPSIPARLRRKKRMTTKRLMKKVSKARTSNLSCSRPASPGQRLSKL